MPWWWGILDLCLTIYMDGNCLEPLSLFQCLTPVSMEREVLVGPEVRAFCCMTSSSAANGPPCCVTWSGFSKGKDESEWGIRLSLTVGCELSWVQWTWMSVEFGYYWQCGLVLEPLSAVAHYSCSHFRALHSTCLIFQGVSAQKTHKSSCAWMI